MNFMQVYLLTGTAERVIAKLREDVFAHLVRLSPGFFTERRTGELTSRLSADLAVLQTLLSTWISELSRQSLFLVGGIVLLTLTHPRLTATTLAVVPVVVGLGVLLRPAAAPGEHRRAGPRGRGDGHGRRGVLADPHRAELRARGARRRGATAALLGGVVTAAIARAQHARDCCSASSASSPSPAWWRCSGRADGSCSRARSRRARSCSSSSTPSPSRRRSARWRRCSAAIRRRSARRSACSSCSRCSPTVAEPAHPAPLRRPVRGAVALRARALPLRARAARRAARRVVHASRRARSWRSSVHRAPARRRSRR